MCFYYCWLWRLSSSIEQKFVKCKIKFTAKLERNNKISMSRHKLIVNELIGEVLITFRSHYFLFLAASRISCKIWSVRVDRRFWRVCLTCYLESKVFPFKQFRKERERLQVACRGNDSSRGIKVTSHTNIDNKIAVNKFFSVYILYYILFYLIFHFILEKYHIVGNVIEESPHSPASYSPQPVIVQPANFYRYIAK